MAGKKFDFSDKLKKFKQLKKELPIITGEESVKFFQDSFRRQGFLNQTVEKWAPRKSKRRGAILVKSGRLRRDIQRGYTSWNRTVIKTSVPYAKVHNEGFKGIVKVKTHQRGEFGKRKVGTGTYSIKTKKERKRTEKYKTGSKTIEGYSKMVTIPKRQFMGRSRKLDIKIKTTIVKEMDKLFKK
jgi:phage gpG-like protein